jgi:hypothetical protein
MSFSKQELFAKFAHFLHFALRSLIQIVEMARSLENPMNKKPPKTGGKKFLNRGNPSFFPSDRPHGRAWSGNH